MHRLRCSGIFLLFSDGMLSWVELNWLFNVTINDISVIYVTARWHVKLFSFSICMKCLWPPASIIILQLFLKIKIIIRIHSGYLWLFLFTANKLQQIEPKKRKPVVTINPATLRVWKPGEKNIPNFDEKESEVAKFSLFKVQSRKSMW